MSLRSDFPLRSLCPALLALPLLACGGGGGGADDARSDVPATDSDQTAVPVGAFYAGRALQTEEDLDSDGDGLIDRVDPLPQRAPEPLPPGAPFDLAGVGVPFGDGVSQGFIHADRPLRLDVPGLAALSDSAWLVLRSGEQDQVIALPAQDMILLDTQQIVGRPNAVAIMTRNWITPWRPVQSIVSGGPLVQAVGQAYTGQPLALQGLNLDRATFSDGTHTLVGHAQGNVFVLDWPGNGAFSELLVSTPQGVIQRLPINWLRRVPVRLDSPIHSVIDQVIFYDGKAFAQFSANQTMQRDVMAFAPTMLGFAHDGDALLPGVFRVVVWPDQTQVNLNLDAWLQAMAMGHPIVREALRDLSWQQQREILDQALIGDALGDGRAALQAALQGDDSAYLNLADRLAREVLAVLPQNSASKLLLGTELVLSDDDVNRRILRYQKGRERNGEADKIFSGSFAHFDVGTVAHLCGNRTAGRPAGVSSGDICVVNRNQVPASVAVRTGNSDSQSLWSDHVSVKAGIFNADILGGTGGFFNLELFGDAGYFGFKQTHFFPKAGDSTLCNSTDCQVEIVTAGYGYGLNESLNSKERSVSEMLRKRAIIDVMILPIVSLATGEDFKYSGKLAQCIATASITALDFVTKSADIYQKINDSKGSDGSLEVSKLASNLLPFVANDLKDVLADARLPACFAQAAAAGSAEAAKDAAEKGLKRVLTRLKASPIGLLMEGFSMAEGWIEIAATPSLLIFETELMVKPRIVQPPVLDVTGDLSDEIQVIGRCLGRKNPSDSDDCANTNGSADPAYHPAYIRFSGRKRVGRGTKRVEVALTAADIAGVKDANGNAEPFPFTSAVTVSMQSVADEIALDILQDQLRPGDVEVDLIYLDADGNRIHLPAGSIELRSFPGPDPVDGMSWSVGKLGFISGYRLERFDVASAKLVLTSVDLNGSQTHEITQLRLSNAGNETDIEFNVPASLLPSNRNMLKFEVYLVTPQQSFELGAVIVNRGAASRSRLSDYGSCKDDTARLQLLNAQNQVVRDADGNKAEILVTPSTWARELKWDNALLSTNEVAKIRIVCEDPGNDICGNSLQFSEGNGASVCTLAYDIDSSQPFFSRKNNISLTKNQEQVLTP